MIGIKDDEIGRRRADEIDCVSAARERVDVESDTGQVQSVTLARIRIVFND
jgi:hypothetical protein